MLAPVIDRLEPRLRDQIHVDALGCWNWLGYKRDGYGSAHRDDGRTVIAHRYVYELLVGPVPAGLELDHLCRNRPCVNPEHLEPVTRQENRRRATYTTCRRGHQDYVSTPTTRYCRSCERLNGPRRMREYRLRLKLRKVAS
jgi:HNH endonuclease